MKTGSGRRNAAGRQVAALVCLWALWLGMLPLAATASDKKTAKLTDEQRVLHVLNRIGFGVRPGDVARAQKMGLDKYIEQQLNPQSIPDAMADDKVKALEVLQLPTSEL